jgi:hypothetical protein
VRQRTREKEEDVDQQERQAWQTLADNSTHWAGKATTEGRTADAQSLKQQAKDANKAARSGRRPGR